MAAGRPHTRGHRCCLPAAEVIHTERAAFLSGRALQPRHPRRWPWPLDVPQRADIVRSRQRSHHVTLTIRTLVLLNPVDVPDSCLRPRSLATLLTRRCPAAGVAAAGAGPGGDQRSADALLPPARRAGPPRLVMGARWRVRPQRAAHTEQVTTTRAMAAAPTVIRTPPLPLLESGMLAMLDPLPCISSSRAVGIRLRDCSVTPRRWSRADMFLGTSTVRVHRRRVVCVQMQSFPVRDEDRVLRVRGAGVPQTPQPQGLLQRLRMTDLGDLCPSP